MEDGAVIKEISNLHVGSILQILITRDDRFMMTCGRDRKIVVYDLHRHNIVQQLNQHKESIQSIVLSKDENFLFSGGDDK